MDDNFSPRVKDVITYSKEEALRLGHDFIGTEHFHKVIPCWTKGWHGNLGTVLVHQLVPGPWDRWDA